MYLGRYYVGEIVPLSYQTVNSSGSPTLPDNPPVIDIRSSVGLVRQVKSPILDRYNATGLFLFPLRLDSAFSAGTYSAIYYATAGGFQNLDFDTFQIVAGGDSEGCILTHYYWQRPEATFLIQQTEAENLLLRRNPSVS